MSTQPLPWPSNSPGEDWHPSVRAFFSYWRSIHRGVALPARRDFEPAAIRKLLPGVWLLDVEREPFRLRYRLAGTAVVRYIGAEVTGRYLDEAHPDIKELPGYLDRYRTVVETKTPSWRRGKPNLSI